MTPNLDTDSQVKLYRATVLTMITAGSGDIPLMISLDESVYAKFDVSTKSCRAHETAAMSEYIATYAEEIELNEAFNKFVRNFLVSYQGPNDAREQVEGAKYENEYSEFLDKKNQSKPGDEFLPLGARFQQHVACFIKYMHVCCVSFPYYTIVSVVMLYNAFLPLCSIYNVILSWCLIHCVVMLLHHCVYVY